MSPDRDRRDSLVDGFGRTHNNLRISVTDRCNLRCMYCMPESVRFLPRSDLLSFEEIERFVRITADLEINKVRLTGGEPLIRREVPGLVARLAAIEGITDLGLTTNGVLLAPMARSLWDAGLRRINISLDTIDPGVFEMVSRRPGFDRVIAGILEAKAVGFDPVKINAVAMRGETETDVVSLARFGREHGLELRFIEYMPLDAENRWERSKVLLAAEILDRLAAEFGPLSPAPDQDPRAPAIDYLYDDGGGRVGLIGSISRPFCASCNRIRLTPEGKLRYCLFAHQETDIRALLRSEATDAEIADAVRVCVSSKWEGHEINSVRFLKPERPMYVIGG